MPGEPHAVSARCVAADHPQRQYDAAPAGQPMNWRCSSVTLLASAASSSTYCRSDCWTRWWMPTSLSSRQSWKHLPPRRRCPPRNKNPNVSYCLLSYHVSRSGTSLTMSTTRAAASGAVSGKRSARSSAIRRAWLPLNGLSVATGSAARANTDSGTDSQLM